MNAIESAKFKFLNYRVSEFHFYPQTKNDDRELELEFNPTGTYFTVDGDFLLEYNFFAKYQDGDESKTSISATMVCLFSFNSPISFEEIPDYFYTNSLAITFPYLRAFISTLTLMGNVNKMIIMPTLNLSNYKDELKSNTKVVNGKMED